MTGAVDDAGRVEIYVWFEASPAVDDAVRTGFARLRDALEQPGARLLRRPDLRARPEGPQATWMEVWPDVPAGTVVPWLERLQGAAVQCGLAAHARDGRHVEVFAADR